MSKHYTIEDYRPYIGDGRSGRDIAQPLPLPNATDVDPLRFLQDLAARGHMLQPVWGYAMLPDGSRQQWTQFFLGGDFAGGAGYAVTYGCSVRKFNICVHEGDGNGFCKHCGGAMTRDSSD